MGYGAEVWKWKNRREIEEIHERFLRWTMGLDCKIPGYMVREKVKKGMMRGRPRISREDWRRKGEERWQGNVER